MSLATRCTACGTVFRVVRDQLRVSEGWVRCGRCAEVFNAAENLVDPPLTAAGAGPGAAMVRMGSGAARPVDPLHAGSGRDLDLPLDGALDAMPDAEPGAVPAWARSTQLPSVPPDTATGDAAREPSSGTPAGADSEPATAARADGGGWPRHTRADPATADDDDAASGAQPATPPPDAAAAGTASQRHPGQALPSFVRRADRAARWQQPRLRAGLAAVVLLGLLGLLAQAGHSYRDLLAARWPATQPLLARACAALGCTVQPPRLIDALVVDSSGLLRVERSRVYKLSVTLRNRDLLPVALPALDLVLTDTQGRLVARRVLSLAELGQTQTSLAAGAELVLQATLQAPETDPGGSVAGYTIEIFYP